MKETAKEAARQRKIYMILIIILIIVLTVLGGGYYFMMQTKAASQKTSGKNVMTRVRRARHQAVTRWNIRAGYINITIISATTYF